MNCRSVAIIKSSKDNRYAADAVVTHDGTKFPCLALSDLSSFKLTFGADAYNKVNLFETLLHSTSTHIFICCYIKLFLLYLKISLKHKLFVTKLIFSSF